MGGLTGEVEWGRGGGFQPQLGSQASSGRAGPRSSPAGLWGTLPDTQHPLGHPQALSPSQITGANGASPLLS